MKEKLRVVFMGTPDFAAVCLEQLLGSRHEVVGVVTAPDRPSGRGQKNKASAVKAVAERAGLPLAQPMKLKDPDFLDVLRSWNAEIGVVVAFRMLPECVWAMPPLGTVNLHASLLPQLRGAAPIQRAIMAGFSVTGVTTFKLQHAIDTGDILEQSSLEIGANETAGSLHDRLLSSGKSLIISTLDGISRGTLVGRAQSEIYGESDEPGSNAKGGLAEAPKLFKEDTKIVWDSPVKEVHNHVRGLTPFPGAWTESQAGSTQIISGAPASIELARDAGKTAQTADEDAGGLWVGKARLAVRCADGWYEVLKLKIPGSKAMETKDFLNGRRDDLGVSFQ